MGLVEVSRRGSVNDRTRKRKSTSITPITQHGRGVVYPIRFQVGGGVGYHISNIVISVTQTINDDTVDNGNAQNNDNSTAVVTPLLTSLLPPMIMGG